MALTFGLTVNNASFGEDIDETRDISVWNRLSRGNLIIAKKFIADDLAIRAGLRLYRDSRSLKGEVDSIPTTGTGQWTLSEVEFKESSREYMLVPGIEKHFSSSNIFDVYAAGDLYLGFGRDKSVNSQTNTDGDVTSTTQTTPYTIVGLGGVIGVNVFVLDLPVSVGVEYGLSAFWQLGNRTKVEVETPDESYEYFTVANDPFSLQGQAYTSLKQKYMTMNTNDQVRIVANIYFN